MADSEDTFGGPWTEQKLEILEKYLRAYVTALKKQKFRLTYVDGFAGIGHIPKRKTEAEDDLLFVSRELEDDIKLFRDGSASIALRVKPSFHRYCFIEQSKRRADNLERLKEKFPDLKDCIYVIRDDCNTAIQRLCVEDWSHQRAVVFLDPYGMQVSWRTIEAIARTQAMDLWVLVPHAIGVNRLLRKDADLSPRVVQRLNAFFGCEDWKERFYNKNGQMGLFYAEQERKTADLKLITEYYLERLRGIFAGVLDKTFILCNSRGAPMYVLCFACGNPRAVPLAKKIADDIIKNCQPWP